MKKNILESDRYKELYDISITAVGSYLMNIGDFLGIGVCVRHQKMACFIIRLQIDLLEQYANTDSDTHVEEPVVEEPEYTIKKSIKECTYTMTRKKGSAYHVEVIKDDTSIFDASVGIDYLKEEDIESEKDKLEEKALTHIRICKKLLAE